MGLVYKEIEREDIVKVLRSRGYGEVNMRRYALAVNKATGEFYESGGEKRNFAWGITQDTFSAIQRYANSPEDAANRCEQAGLGNEMQPIEAAKSDAQPSTGLSMEVAEKLITNRSASEVARLIAPVYAELASLAGRMTELVEMVQKANAKGKPGRPKGSKNKPKQDEAPAA